VAGNDYHRYIYELEQRRILGDFEGAYANCDDVWPTQHQLDLPHFLYVKGLVAGRSRSLGRPVRVLDIGCGYGDLVHELNRAGGCEALGLEISASAVNKGRERFGAGHKVMVGDWRNGIPAGERSFDVVLALGIFWFILDRIDFCLGELERIAADRAEFVFTLHVPPDPIGKETIASYDDFLGILRRRLEIVDVFKFYQRQGLRAATPLAATLSDIVVRCRRKGEG
jgi:SAM-dependent methyltransferase